MWTFILALCLYEFVHTKASLIPGVSTDVLAKRYISWSGGIHECENFKNKYANIENLVVDKKNKTFITLAGDLIMTDDTSKDMEFKVDIYKRVNDQWEYLLNVKVKNLCDHVGEKNKPWTPFIEEMKVQACPISKNKYTFSDLTLDTTGFPLTEANDGSYKAQAEIYESGEMTICLLVFAEVGPM